ncbi:hypothetical protein TTHERM_000780428 (macronuclear) [Tetrahymena thermophila SB210]|uniref:Uncharacterized protein n=1 Tax=Tetrahymena thermophila (strain SB210) TaxID=312017 RepID=W7XCC2_TETTS|nr:hypothetical protein TTHERM_000780428 [Tetrahymena thermophila SB210]EWS71386.1 hypothetical protein TTHERM_000780428 [Tetrahymena thermophila SB210]|eukprot:XP_012656087.1 hypothetical protein TTHERM_000780428 [Tetrahymena thermophila SB210]
MSSLKEDDKFILHELNFLNGKGKDLTLFHYTRRATTLALSTATLFLKDLKLVFQFNSNLFIQNVTTFLKFNLHQIDIYIYNLRQASNIVNYLLHSQIKDNYIWAIHLKHYRLNHNLNLILITVITISHGQYLQQ